MREPDDLTEWLQQQRRAIGDRIYAHRHECGYSQQHLGELTGMDRRTIGKIERGLAVANVDQLHLLARALGVEPIAFFWG